jgi:tetratricopeptide (TPR) repeat protein
LVAVLAFVALRSFGQVQAYGTADIQRKLSAWRWTLPMIRDHAWVGVGRGAFATAFPAYRLGLADDWTAAYSYAENFVLQWLSEWGVVVGAFAIVAIIGYVVLELHAVRRERLRLLLLTGVCTLLLQNLADLGLEVPSVMIAAVVAVAAGERARPAQPAPAQAMAWVGALGTVSVLLVVWLCATSWSRWPVEEERSQASVDYRQLSLSDADERAAFYGELHDAMLRHPGEAHFPLLGALIAFRTHSEGALPWLGRAIELSPTDGRVHLVLAELLAAHRATTQAIFHLRLALQYDETLGGAVATHLSQWAPTMHTLLQGIPRSPRGAVVLTNACALVKDPALRVACFREAVAWSPQEIAPRRQLADSLLRAVGSGVPPCGAPDKAACYEEVDRTARAVAKVDPKSWQSVYILAKNFEAKGDLTRAAELYAKTCPAGDEGQQCSQESVLVAIASTSDPAILTAADAFAARSCDSSAACAAALDWLGASLDGAGKTAFAVSYFTKAAEAEGSAARWLRVAQRASTLRLPGVARPALDRADHSPDATAATRLASNELRAELARSSTLGL